MSKLSWNEEGTIIKTFEDGTKGQLVGSVGPEVTEKQRRHKELQHRLNQLEVNSNQVRLEMQEIVQWFARNGDAP